MNRFIAPANFLPAVSTNETGPIVDLGYASTNIGMFVIISGVVSAYSVQLKGGVDPNNLFNIGFPIALAGTLGTTIGPVTNGTFNIATWGACPIRYVQAALSGYSGTGTVAAELMAA